jgi:archaellum component FlaC
MADVSTTLKDAAYTTVGFGVLGFQKVQVRRVELMKQVDEQRAALESQIADITKTVSGTTNEATTKAGAQVATLTQALEAQLTELTRLVKELAKDVDARFVPVRDQLEERIDLVEDRLPEQARDLLKQARAVAKDTEAQLRARLGFVAA